jgi:hypothetical protein
VILEQNLTSYLSDMYQPRKTCGETWKEYTMSYDSPSYQHIGMNPNGTYITDRRRALFQEQPRINKEMVSIEQRDFSTLLRQARSGDKAAIAELRVRGSNTGRNPTKK